MKKNYFLSMFFLGAIFTLSAQEETKKAVELNEVAIVKTKKAIEQKADRTIFDFSGQPSLNSGSVLEGIKKLPGLIASDVAGMMYQGKQLDVFMDGRPLNITSNELNSFLEGMPANAIEKIEIITQPGAEFPATSGGAIMNIITNKNAKNYLSGRGPARAVAAARRDGATAADRRAVRRLARRQHTQDRRWRQRCQRGRPGRRRMLRRRLVGKGIRLRGFGLGHARRHRDRAGQCGCLGDVGADRRRRADPDRHARASQGLRPPERATAFVPGGRRPDGGWRVAWRCHGGCRCRRRRIGFRRKRALNAWPTLNCRASGTSK